MRCTCDEIHELDPLNPASEICPLHDVEYDDNDEWGSYYGAHIIDEPNPETIYS